MPYDFIYELEQLIDKWKSVVTCSSSYDPIKDVYYAKFYSKILNERQIDI